MHLKYWLLSVIPTNVVSQTHSDITLIISSRFIFHTSDLMGIKEHYITLYNCFHRLSSCKIVFMCKLCAPIRYVLT